MQIHPLQHLLPAHRKPQLKLSMRAVKVDLKDAAVSAQSAVAVMAGALDVVVARGVAKDANHVKKVEEMVVAESVANVILKARRAMSAQPVTQPSAPKGLVRSANLLNPAKHGNPARLVRVAAIAVNVVVSEQSVVVSALTAIQQSKTWHSPTKRLWPQPWAVSRSSVQTHHKVSAASVASARTAAVSVVVTAIAAVERGAMTAPKAAVVT